MRLNRSKVSPRHSGGVEHERHHLTECLSLRGCKQRRLGLLQQRYGMAEEEALRQVDAWEQRGLEKVPLETASGTGRERGQAVRDTKRGDATGRDTEGGATDLAR